MSARNYMYVVVDRDSFPLDTRWQAETSASEHAKRSTALPSLYICDEDHGWDGAKVGLMTGSFAGRVSLLQYLDQLYTARRSHWPFVKRGQHLPMTLLFLYTRTPNRPTGVQKHSI